MTTAAAVHCEINISLAAMIPRVQSIGLDEIDDCFDCVVDALVVMWLMAMASTSVLKFEKFLAGRTQ